MKKHLHLVLLCLFSVCLGLKAEVYSGECGKTGSNLSWTLDTETGELVISGEGEMNNNPWIAYKDYIRSVSIQDGVLNIVNSAFADCSNLANVTIAETVSKIEYYAFC